MVNLQLHLNVINVCSCLFIPWPIHMQNLSNKKYWNKIYCLTSLVSIRICRFQDILNLFWLRHIAIKYDESQQQNNTNNSNNNSANEDFIPLLLLTKVIIHIHLVKIV